MSGLEHQLSLAEQLETEYRWSQAADCYRAVLTLPTEDSFLLGDVWERLGYATYRGARQMGSWEDFSRLVREAISAYGLAKASYEKSGEPSKKGRILRCEAALQLLHYWVTVDSSEKKRRLGESQKYAELALEQFQEMGMAGELWKTVSILSLVPFLYYGFEPSYDVRDRLAKKMSRHAEDCVRYLEGQNAPEESSKAHVLVASWLDGVDSKDDLEYADRLAKDALAHWNAALKLSRRTALTEISSIVIGATLEWEGTEKGLHAWDMAVRYSRKTRDHLLIGAALNMLSYHTYRSSALTDNMNRLRKLAEKGLRFAEQAKEQYHPLRFRSPHPNPWVEEPYARHYMALARYQEADPNRRRELVRKGLNACPQLIRRAEKCGGWHVLVGAQHTYGTLLALGARTETDPSRKKILLASALEQETRALGFAESQMPFAYWSLGLFRSIRANIMAELADLEESSASKVDMLEKAIKEKETSLELAAKHVAFLENTKHVPQASGVALRFCEYGDFLYRISKLNGSREPVKRALKAYAEAGKYYRKVDRASRIAECHWKCALLCDDLSDYLSAAEEFLHASSDYKEASDKVPRLRQLYQDHAVYMEAWHEIEKARQCHSNEDFGKARDHYKRAADLHSSTKSWAPLAPNYSAWSLLEEGDELSKTDQNERAIDVFREAENLFKDSLVNVKKQLGSAEDRQESHSLTTIVKTMRLRQEYCEARVVLEEATILGKRGDLSGASQKYGMAAENFEQMSNGIGSEQDTRTTKRLAAFCKAWELMAQAEAGASPKLYLDASKLFEHAKELGPSDKSAYQALGHSRICKALEAVNRFADGRDRAVYDQAEKLLESAADYYIRSGSPSASMYTKATKLLLEGYMFLRDAATERDPEKKAKLCAMAEQVLEASANSFAESQHSSRSQQVTKLLERVRGDKELAMLLAEVLTASTMDSTKTRIPVPDQIYESATGLERFARADIRADMIVERRSLVLGERLEIEMELVNAGKGVAQLVKIDDVAPQGFEVVDSANKQEIKERSIDVQGKRLGPLNTYAVKIATKPLTPGITVLRPSIRYLDENGDYRVHRPEPIDIVVKAPYIPEWLKATGETNVPGEFRFKTERAKKVFQTLAMAFREDYVVKGLFLDKAGWRSLIHLIRTTRIPRSGFYSPRGRRGPVLEELESLGLVDLRIFPGERGRGGAITRVRLAYEAAILKGPK